MTKYSRQKLLIPISDYERRGQVSLCGVKRYRKWRLACARGCVVGEVHITAKKLLNWIEPCSKQELLSNLSAIEVDERYKNEIVATSNLYILIVLAAR